MNTDRLFTMATFYAMVLFLPAAALALYRKPSLWPFLLAGFTGYFVALIDLQTDEVQLPAVLLLVFSLFIGFNNRTSAWRWGVLLGGWIPAMQFVRIGLEQGNGRFFQEGVGSLAAVAFAMAGAYAGSAIRCGAEKKDRVDGAVSRRDPTNDHSV
jgi:hypothetical protein